MSVWVYMCVCVCVYAKWRIRFLVLMAVLVILTGTDGLVFWLVFEGHNRRAGLVLQVQTVARGVSVLWTEMMKGINRINVNVQVK